MRMLISETLQTQTMSRVADIVALKSLQRYSDSHSSQMLNGIKEEG